MDRSEGPDSAAETPAPAPVPDSPPVTGIDRVCSRYGHASCVARVLEVLGAGIIICDHSGRVLFLNRAGARVLDVDEAEVIGRDVSSLLAPLETLHERIALVGDGGSAEVQTNRPDGSVMHIGYQLGRTDGLPGAAPGFQTVVLFRDICEQIQVRRERDRFLRLATVSRLLPTVAHEIRNPLAGIQSLVEVMAEEISEVRHREDLAAILTEVERLRAVVDGLGLVDGDLLRGGSDLNLAAEVAVPLRVLEPRAGALGVHLHREIDADLRASLNPAVLRLVVFNLVVNALEACVRGDSITLRAQRNACQLALEVADTGSGMPAEVAARATELFYTTKGRGSGIGLSLVAETVRRAGGSITIESVPGVGTTVRVHVPQEDPS